MEQHDDRMAVSPSLPQGPGQTPPAERTQGEEQGRAQQALQSAEGHAKDVAREASHEVRGVVDEARSRVRDEARQQTDRVRGVLENTSGRLSALADGRVEEAGPLADQSRRLASMLDDLAGRVERLGFDGIVDEASRFARRRPGTFLLGAAAAGMLVGRLGRNAAGDGAGTRESGREQAPRSVGADSGPAAVPSPGTSGAQTPAGGMSGAAPAAGMTGAQTPAAQAPGASTPQVPDPWTAQTQGGHGRGGRDDV